MTQKNRKIYQKSCAKNIEILEEKDPTKKPLPPLPKNQSFEKKSEKHEKDYETFATKQQTQKGFDRTPSNPFFEIEKKNSEKKNLTTKFS